VQPHGATPRNLPGFVEVRTRQFRLSLSTNSTSRQKSGWEKGVLFSNENLVSCRPWFSTQSNMPKTITSSELLPLLEKVQSDFLDFITGFVKPYTVRTRPSAGKPDREHFDAALGGSGTLVSAAAVRGILTADHVLSEFPQVPRSV